MFRIQAPIVIIPTADAKLALGPDLQAAGLAAYREIAMAAKGLEISFSPIRLPPADACGVLADSSRRRRRNRDRPRRPAPPQERIHRRPDAAG